jgi:hypothetical protein
MSVEGLQQQYATMCCQRCTQMNGGQNQRITIKCKIAL